MNIEKENNNKAIAFAMSTFGKIPKDDEKAFESYLAAMLVVFWGALWGSFGTEYARDFISRQLAGMADGVPFNQFEPPKAH